MNIFKRNKCQHEFFCKERFYGDIINYVDARSRWVCSKCGKEIYSDVLNGIVFKHNGLFKTILNYFRVYENPDENGSNTYIYYDHPVWFSCLNPNYFISIFKNKVILERWNCTETEEGNEMWAESRWQFARNITKGNMDISSTNNYPSNSLSNFAAHPFTFRGLEVNSMEGFLQGLKFKSPEMQAEVFKLVGRAAKKKGSSKNWRESQTLWFQGQPIKRQSKEYQDLLDEAYEELYKNSKFRNALRSTGDATLTHSIGKTNQKETILTRSEFCSRLKKLREQGWLRESSNPNKPLF